MVIEPNSKPFKPVIDALQKKTSISTRHWYDVLGDAHEAAYVAAGLTKKDALDAMLTLVRYTKSKGKSAAWFKKRFKKIARDAGWAYKGGEDRRPFVHLHTNSRAAYHAARWQQMNHPAVKKLRPYGVYKTGFSKEHRPEHKKRDGWVVPLEHEFWKHWKPQNGYGCNCSMFTITEREAKRRGYKILNPKIETEQVTLPSGDMVTTAKGVDAGFDDAGLEQSKLGYLNKALRARKDYAELKQLLRHKHVRRAQSDENFPENNVLLAISSDLGLNSDTYKNIQQVLLPAMRKKFLLDDAAVLADCELYAHTEKQKPQPMGSDNVLIYLESLGLTAADIAQFQKLFNGDLQTLTNLLRNRDANRLLALCSLDAVQQLLTALAQKQIDNVYTSVLLLKRFHNDRLLNVILERLLPNVNETVETAFDTKRRNA